MQCSMSKTLCGQDNTWIFFLKKKKGREREKNENRYDDNAPNNPTENFIIPKFW